MGEKQEMESDDREDGSTIESKSAAAGRLKSFHLLEMALSIDTAKVEDEVLAAWHHN